MTMQSVAAWVFLFSAAPSLPAHASEPSQVSGRAPEGIAVPSRGQLLENAYLVGRGMLRIDAGMHSPEANAFHRAVCESRGGRDITDEAPVDFSATSSDAFVCAEQSDHAPSAEPVPVTVDAQGRLRVQQPTSGHVANGGARQPPAFKEVGPGTQN